VAALTNGVILVVDPDDGFRGYASSLLRRVGYRTVEEANGEDAVEAARELKPDLVVVEIELPGVSGFQICRELRDAFGEELPIIFVSGNRTASIDRVAGLLIGADDYLVKPIAPEELLARIRRLLVRSALGSSPRTRPANASALSLSPREREVLRLLAEGHTKKAIGQALFISPKTVATHVQRILNKLGARSRAEAVAYAYRYGLVDSGEDLALASSGP
jgi:DNA-binding NarL/FixJ family response regulator